MGDTTNLKSKIRERYQGTGQDILDVIPAIPEAGFHSQTSVKRVAVYARVSTDDLRQTSSYELQKNHYTDMIRQRSGWELAEIYADEGISGTSLKHRDAFVRMIADCEEGKIDLIVTKSVSRFARNLLDCISYVRKLKDLKPPVGIFFETENIYTLNSSNELSLSFLATFAQEESHNKSEIMNASIEMRFKRGIFLTPALLGYDRDENGNLTVNEEEARIVRLIFFLYLYGYSCRQIAGILTNTGCKTKKGNTVWSAGSIFGILQNERHCGDILARKTFTPNYLDHKAKKNRKDRNQYIWRDHHESIIPRGDFIAVQRLLANAKYGNRGILPQTEVITEGVFRGFVPVHPKWGGFRPDDYRLASQSVPDKTPDCFSPALENAVLQGFQVVRAQFFNTPERICVTFRTKTVRFSAEAIRRMCCCEYVEFLVHPDHMLFAVRPSTKEDRHAIRWAADKKGKTVSRQIHGCAYLPTLFTLFGWESGYRYRILGICHRNTEESILIFNLREAEVFMSSSTREAVCPPEWETGFGSDSLTHAQARETASFSGREWKASIKSQPYAEPDIHVTDTAKIHDGIHSILRELQETAETAQIRKHPETLQ